MRKALVTNGVVTQVAEFGQDVPDWAADWVDTIDDAGIGWTYDSATDAFAAPAVDLASLREAASLPRKQFARAAAVAGFITFAEASDYANGIAVPASVEAIIATFPAAEQDFRRFDVLTEENVRRNGALMPGLIVAFSTDDAGADALFGIG